MTEPPAPSADDVLKARAVAICKPVWERKPVPAQPFVAAVKVAKALINAGHADADITAAMLAVPTISVRWVEAELNKRRTTPDAQRGARDIDRTATPTVERISK